MRDDVLAKVKDNRLKVYVVWEPIMPKDGPEPLVAAAAVMAGETRAVQYWDGGAVSGKAYVKKLNLPLKSAAWDIYFLFPPGVKWEKDPPAPSFWMHQLNFLPFTDGDNNFGHLRLDAARFLEEVQRATSASKQHKPSASHESLKRFLQEWENPGLAERDTRFFAAFVDLNGDGKDDAIVLLMGWGWCGTGGCRTLILQQQNRSWRVVSKFTIANPPIRVLTSRSNGWRDVGVWVQGGGIQPGYEARLSFDGRSYPGHPTVSSALSRKGGVVVMSEQEKGAPLWP